MECLLNASLAGAVFMGANAEIMLNPYGPMLGGFLVGVIACLGYIFVTPFLRRKFNLHDTCGVHNTFAMPGFCGGIVSSILAARGEINFGGNYDKVFFPLNLRPHSYQSGY